jgi:hypothetical protein
MGLMSRMRNGNTEKKKENMTCRGYQQIQEKYVKINMSGDCSYKYPILTWGPTIYLEKRGVNKKIF